MEPTDEKSVEKSAAPSEQPTKTAEVVELPEPKANTQQDSPPVSAAQQPAEVIDLEKVRDEKATQMRGEAEAIVEMCALANQSALAGAFIAKGMDVNAVRKELLSRRAAGEEIHSHLMPGDGTRVRPEENLNANPVVVACQRLAKQSAVGE